MKVLNNLFNFTRHREQEVDDEIIRKKERFREELARLEALAIEAKVRGRDWHDGSHADNKPG